MDIKEKIRVYALENAVKFKGKCNPKSLVGKLMGEFPEYRAKAQELMKLLDEVGNEVNCLSSDEQQKELDNVSDELKSVQKEKKKADDLKDFKNVDKDKGVIMRFAPSPSGPMHLGHAITGGITSLYVKKYGGKYILRIEDTNSDNIYTPAYELLKEDGDWCFGNITDVWIQSDRMDIYYDYVMKLFDKNAVYVCSCSQEDFKTHTSEMSDCPCRELSVDEQKKRWSMMLGTNSDKRYEKGEAVLRMKADMKHPNPAMRDFPLARINETIHPRQGDKYRVWPLMNLSVTVDDIEAGMTHIIRAKDHADNAKRQEYIYNSLEKPIPETYFMGRINFEGLEMSASKTKAKIEAGEFSGWDDIRLPFLGAYKRRGIKSEAFMKYVKGVGISLVDKRVQADEFHKTIYAFNKEIVDPIANRFYFVKEPVEIEIKGSPEKEVELDLHPETKKGGRTFTCASKYIIDKEDYNKIEEGKVYRLIDNLNFEKVGNELKFVSTSHDEFKDLSNKGFLMHWLTNNDGSEEENAKVIAFMPNGFKYEGFAEKSFSKSIVVGDVVQFERFGFLRLDKVDESDSDNKVYEFWYAHK